MKNYEFSIKGNFLIAFGVFEKFPPDSFYAITIKEDSVSFQGNGSESVIKIASKLHFIKKSCISHLYLEMIKDNLRLIFSDYNPNGDLLPFSPDIIKAP